MNRLPPDESDDKLIYLLKSYRPVPPPAPIHLEEQIMAKIQKEPVSSPYSSHWRWLLPGVLAAAGLIVMGSYRWFAPTPQIAANPEEIEAFLIESWTGTMGNTFVPTTQVSHSDIVWLTMAYP